MNITLEEAIGVIIKNAAKDLELIKAKATDSSDHIMELPPCNGLVNASVPQTRSERRKLERRRQKELIRKRKCTKVRIHMS